MRPLGFMLIAFGGTLLGMDLVGTTVALFPVSHTQQLAISAGMMFVGVIMIMLAPREARN